MNKSQQIMVAEGLPRACILTDAQRAKAWQGVKLQAIPLFRLTPKDESPETKAFRAQVEAERRQKSLAQIAKMKTRFAAKAIDYTKMRWDARRNKFVPIEPGTTKSVPAVKAPSGDSAVKARRETTPAGTDIDWSRITTETAEALARLNGVWKDSYEKLRGTGRIVMTVSNVLKGKVKRGEAVKWQ